MEQKTKTSLRGDKRRNGFYRKLRLDERTMKLITEFRKFKLNNK